MRNLAFVATALIGAACAGPQNPDDFLAVGAPAPEFSATDQHGKAVTLSELRRDGPVVLTFLRSFY